MFSTTLPPLTSLGHALDTSTEAFGELQSSIDLLHDAPTLRERMQSDGYLYLPGYLDREAVLTARCEILNRLSDAGKLDPDLPIPQGIARSGSGNPNMQGLTEENAPLQALLYSGRMMAFYEMFFGAPVRHFDFTWLRAMSAGKATAPHCDIVFMGRGTQNLLTAWTPLGDVDFETGGLMLLEGSHRHEKLKANYGRKDVDAFCSNRRAVAPQGLGGGGNIRESGALTGDAVKLRERLGGRWLTAQFQMGDLLTFGMFTVHASLDNHSNRLRLSSDSRYQLASEAADERWIGPNPVGHGPGAKRGMIC